MKFYALSAFLLTALYVGAAPAPDFRPVELDMAEACATVFAVCSTNPADHHYLKTPKFLPQPTVYMSSAQIGPYMAVLLTILMTMGNLLGHGIYRWTRDFHRLITRLDYEASEEGFPTAEETYPSGE